MVKIFNEQKGKGSNHVYLSIWSQIRFGCKTLKYSPKIHVTDVDLIAIGPLTNLAVAFSLDFDLPKKRFIYKTNYMPDI